MALASCNYLTHTGGSTAILLINGSASYVNCGVMREFIAGLEEQAGKTDLVIDFQRCQGLDSTVLGLIAKSAMALSAKTPPGRTILANLDGRNLELVKNLGLQHVCELAETPVTTASEGTTQLMPNTPPGNMCDSACILEAHEALVKAHPENDAKFHDVIESLKALL